MVVLNLVAVLCLALVPAVLTQELNETDSLIPGKLAGGTAIFPNIQALIVGITTQSNQFCTGVIVSSTRIVSAASCLQLGEGQDRIMSFSYSGTLITPDPTTYSVLSHPFYRRIEFRNNVYYNFNVAVIISTFAAQLIPNLPDLIVNIPGDGILPSSALVNNDVLYLVGYGRVTNTGQPSPVPLTGVRRYSTALRCAFRDVTPDNTFCTSTSSTTAQPSVALCPGDEGGPVFKIDPLSVQFGFSIVGIMSFTSSPTQCTRLNALNVHTRADAVWPWVQAVL